MPASGPAQPTSLFRTIRDELFDVESRDLHALSRLCVRLVQTRGPRYGLRAGHQAIDGRCPSCDELLADLVECPTHDGKGRPIQYTNNRHGQMIYSHVKLCFVDKLTASVSRYYRETFPVKVPLRWIKDDAGLEETLDRSKAGDVLADTMGDTKECPDCDFFALSLSQYSLHVAEVHDVWIPIPAAGRRRPSNRMGTPLQTSPTADGDNLVLPPAIFWYRDQSYNVDPIKTEVKARSFYDELFHSTSRQIERFGRSSSFEYSPSQLAEDDCDYAPDTRYSLVIAAKGEIEQEGFDIFRVNDPTLSYSDRMKSYDNLIVFQSELRTSLRLVLLAVDRMYDIKTIERVPRRTDRSSVRGPIDASADSSYRPDTRRVAKTDVIYIRRDEPNPEIPVPACQARAVQPAFVVVNGKLVCPDLVCLRNQRTFKSQLEFANHFVVVHGLPFYGGRKSNEWSLDRQGFDQELLDDLKSGVVPVKVSVTSLPDQHK